MPAGRGATAVVFDRACRYRILLVDDEATLRAMGKSILESQGYEVLCAGDGLEGLAALENALPDMIISDLRMPNMNGYDFLSAVRRRFPAVPVVVISGEFPGVSVPESVLADAYFAKGSYKQAALFEKLGELLTQRPARLPIAASAARLRRGQERQGDAGVHLLRRAEHLSGAAGQARTERGEG